MSALVGHIFFSSLIPSFMFFTPSERTQNLLTTLRDIFDVFFIYTYIYKYSDFPIYTYTYLHLFTLIFIFVLYHIYIYTYSCYRYHMPLLLLSKLDEIDKMWGIKKLRQNLWVLRMIITLFLWLSCFRVSLYHYKENYNLLL